MSAPENKDSRVVKSFGLEWSIYDQKSVPDEEMLKIFNAYFSVFPWEKLPPQCCGFDVGCGSGRWDKFVAPRVGKLYCIDASEQAVEIARCNVTAENVEFLCASIEDIPLADNSMDFGFCLGVLHYVPDAQAGIQSCVRKLKEGAPFLIYIYYAFDNRPAWYRLLWKCSDVMRKIISSFPPFLKHFTSRSIATLVYWPVARYAKAMEKCGRNVSNYPLSSYRDKSYYTMCTDAYGRFCTQIEHRFTKKQVRDMMEAAGLSDIQFADFPYWCAMGIKSSSVDGNA